MSDADRAYAAAEQEIENARAAGSTTLSFYDERFRALDRLPPEVGALTQIGSLDLRNTQVTGLTPLQSLTALQTLHLDNTQVTDLTPLQGLTALQRLFLNGTQVADVAPLHCLTALWRLHLDNTPVTDLSPLQGLTALQMLTLNYTPAGDLGPLRGLTALQRLGLDRTSVADLAPLQGLTALRTLGLARTQVADLAPLRGLTVLRTLHLAGTSVADLTPLQGLTVLRTLHLAGTSVADLTPLQGLTALHTLFLNGTPVADLAPLQGLTALQRLNLDSTQVTDLRPIAGLPMLGEGQFGGLHFNDTPAARATPELTRLSEIEDDQQRIHETLAYLKTLPPWPEPLPWDIPDGPLPGTPPDAPDPAGVPRLVLTPDRRIDIAHSPATGADIADPIKERLYARLPGAVERLARYHNRYPDELAPAEILKDIVSVPFAEADILDIHLQIGALTDLREADARKDEAERLDADCMAALDGVLRLGPPVTMGHPDVDLFEKRSTAYARTRRPATEAEGERQVARALSGQQRLATDRTRTTAAQLAGAGDSGRVAAYRSDFHRNAVLALGHIAGALGDAATGYVATEVVVAAAQFVVTHKDAIMATAPAWGQTGYRWAEYLIMRADLILKQARRGEGGDAP